MERNEILEKVQDIFRDVLDNDELVLVEQMTAKDVEGWTSLSQAQILTAIEQQMGFRFTLKEIMTMKSVGQIVDAIASK